MFLFPKLMGCGLAKGNWNKYEELILNFQLNNPESVIRIIDFNS
jgi:hypothetical protein